MISPARFSAKRRRWVVLLALVLFALVYAGRELSAAAEDGVGLLYAFPVMLIALEFGLLGGIAASAFVVILSLASIHSGLALSELGYITRFTVIFGIGIVAGWFADHARRLQGSRQADQRKSKRFFELSSDLLCTLGPDGRFGDLNPSWERTLGYSEDEIRATLFVDLIHPDDRERSAAEAGALAEGDTTVDFENRYVTKDGSIRRLNWSARLDTSDGLIYARATDVTDRRAAEDVLRELIESAPDAMVTVDEQGIIELVNGRTEELFRYRRHELVGLPVDTLLPDGVRAQIEPWLHGPERTASGRDTRVAMETVGRDQTGRVFPVEVSLSPMTAGAGRYAVAAVRDITDRKRADRRQRATTAALKGSNEDLRKFAQVASHDLAEPLRSIGGFAQLLQRRYGDQIDERGNDYIVRMVGGVERMEALIRDLLQFSIAGRDELVRAEVNMDEVAQEVLEELHELITEKHAEVEVADLPVVSGDHMQLNRLLGNLLSNSLKFSNGGRPRVELSAVRAGYGWTFAVADNGIGIPERHRERIFGPFQRLHSRDEYAGTGIGLAICTRIVERHGGEIQVEDGLGGRGTRILFSIPDALGH